MMKKYILLITFLLVSLNFNGSALFVPQDIGEIPIRELKPPGDRPRDEGNPRFVCTLIQEVVALHVVGTTISAIVTINNLTDGIEASYNTVIGIIPVLFPLFGTGDYVITITMSSGAIYQGTFNY